MIHHLSGDMLSSAMLVAGLYGRRGGIDTGTLIVWLVVAVVVVGAIVGVAIVAHRAANKFRHNSHQGVFFGLCKAHGLGRKERALLGQIGRAHNVRFPSEVFIDPNYLHPKKLPGSLKSKQNEIGRLYVRLFGDPSAKPQKKSKTPAKKA